MSRATDNVKCVTKLQERLNDRGASLKVDGWGGRSTLQALDRQLPFRDDAESGEESVTMLNQVGRLSYVGRGFSLEDFTEYLAASDLSWGPDLVVIHHTASPSLAQRPRGFEPQHMNNLAHFYGVERQWSGAPHLFVDEDQVWVLNPLDRPGVHAVSWNRRSIGIEMLGDYDHEDHTDGRGRNVYETTVEATARVLEALDLGVEAIRFHREDRRTSKTCPGRLVSKMDFVDAVEGALL